MGAKIVTVTSGKGGVGKTTATANLAAALAVGGFRVVCIDADIGLRNLDLVLGMENRITFDLVDIIEGRCRLRQAMIRDNRLPELFLIPAAQTRDKNAVSPSDMVRLCDDLRPECDWILIDSPAGIERGFFYAIAPADMILVITSPELSAVRDADRIVGLVEEEKKFQPGLLLNRVRMQWVKRPGMLSPEAVVELLAIQLIGVIPEDDSVILSAGRGQLVALDIKSKAGQAYRNSARRLHGETVAFMHLDSRNGFTSRLANLLHSKGAP